MRTNLTVGISYGDSIDKAREVILSCLEKLFPQVLVDPAPIVAVDNLGSSTVNLKIYFWFTASEISLLKVNSLVAQKVKEALMSANISLPDDAREVVFASPLKIQRFSKEDSIELEKSQKRQIQQSLQSDFSPKVDLTNEIEELKVNAKKSKNAEAGMDIL